MSKDEKPLTVDCATHGRKAWRGDVICTNCNRLYQTEEPTQPRYAPRVCECGVRLMPGRGKNKTAEFSARMVCRPCFVAATQEAS